MAFSRLIIVTLGILDMKKFKNHCCSRTFLLSRVVLLSNKTKKWYGTLTLFLTHSFFLVSCLSAAARQFDRMLTQKDFIATVWLDADSEGLHCYCLTGC